MKHLIYLILITTLLLAFIIGIWIDNNYSEKITITALLVAIIIVLIKDWKSIIKNF